MRSKRTVIACVTNLKNCETIISEAQKIADDENCRLHILNIQECGEFSKEQCNAAEYLYNLSKEYNAQLTIDYTDTIPALSAIKYIKKHKAAHLVTGIPAEGDNGFVSIISSVLPKVKISMVSQKGGIYTFENLYLLKSISQKTV